MRRIFEKHPPEKLPQFKQVKGNFPKHPYFFFSQFKQVKGIFFNHRFWVSKSYPFVLMSEGNKNWKEFLQCQDYQRKQNKNGRSFGTRKQADGDTTSCVVNAETNVSRVSEQRLFIAQNTILKEVLNQHLKTTNSTIRVKAENYTRTNFESRIKRKIVVFDTLLIQKIKERRETNWITNLSGGKPKPLLLWEFRKPFCQIRHTKVYQPIPHCCTEYCLTEWACLPRTKKVLPTATVMCLYIAHSKIYAKHFPVDTIKPRKC